VVNKLDIIANQAGLTPEQKKQINGLSQMLDTHKTLKSMPEPQAQQAYAQKTPQQKESLLNFFGYDEDANILGNAFNYAKATIAAPFKVLNEASDFMTRVYRTGAIAVDQGVDIGKAWDIANDKGDKVFSPSRIAKAKELYGDDMITVAMKVASGTSLDTIMVEGTDAEKEIASTAARLKDKDGLFKRALGAAQAAKYSPGRQFANLLLPESMEGTSALYTGISGFYDAAYRVFSDPTLVLGKAKKAYDAGSWLLFRIVGKEDYSYGRSLLGTINDNAAVNRVFENPKVTNFFDTYGKELDKLATARKNGELQAAADASTTLKRIAPEFGPAAVDEFISAGIKNAETAKNYLKNVTDTSFILRGQATRKTPLVPVLDAARKARINTLTMTDRVFNIDKVGKTIVNDLYGLSASSDDIAQTLSTKPEKVSAREGGSFRFTNDEFRRRVDRFAAKFTNIPYFKDNFFDVNAPDSADKVYQLARLGNSRYHAKIIAEAFRAGDEGQKEQIFKGIWTTLAEIKGWNKSTAGLQQLNNQFSRVQQYAPTVMREVVDEAGNVKTERFNPANFDGEQLAVLDWQLSSGIRVPNLLELDSYVAKDALTARILGPNYKAWMDKVTSWWVFGTLAGPRFVIRNAAEDLMVHAAIGESPFGIIAGRQFATRLGIAGSEGKLGFVNKLVRRKDIAKYGEKLEAAKKTGDPQEVRRVMAEALIDDNLGKTLDKAGGALLARHLKYTNIDDYLESVADGSKNALRGASQYMNVTQDVSKYGSKMGVLEVDGLKYKAATGSSFGDLAPTVSQENRISWMMTIAANANSDLGALAIQYLAPNISRKTAVNGIRAYLDELPESARGRFQLYTKPGVTTQQHAESIYDTVRQYFVKRNGELNTDLLSKVRTVDKDGKIKVSSAGLHLEDLPGKFQADLAPEFISGPMLIPYTGDNFAGGIMEFGWDLMGAANARLTRYPLAQDALVDVLKTMEKSGFRKRYIEKVTANLEGDALIKATDNAERQLAAMAEDLSKNRVLSFVDNPEVRTQLAMSVRNFSRFYRATEDFYRRAIRTVRYNPESLARASLTYEGISHSGFVQTDDKGEQYFFYPGLSPVYAVMAKIGPLFGVKNSFMAPMPVEFGAQIKMITPSLNPDSLFPTFAGPLAALPIKMVGNIVPAVADLEKYLLGSYGEDQPLISSVLPSHVNRLLAAMNRDERSSQYASAMRKSATYLQASGHGIETKVDPATGLEIPPTAGELAEYQNKLQSSTMTVLAMRFIFGFFAPASPQVTLKSDMAKWVRDNGRMNYKQVFNKMIEKYNGDIDKAVGEWIKYYPDQMPYTVSESDTTVVANVRAVDKATSWVKDNKALLEQYPEAASFLIPQAGEFDFEAYKLLFSQGIKTSKTVTDFVRQVAVAKDREIYYQKKDEYDVMLSQALPVALKRQINDQWDAWASEFKGARPLLQEELGKGAQTAIQRNKALEDLRLMLSDNTVTASAPTRKVLKKMLEQYDSYISARDYADQPGVDISQSSIDQMKVGAQSALQAIAGSNPNAVAAYNSLFAPLFR
jgi:hypothetical protein